MAKRKAKSTAKRKKKVSRKELAQHNEHLQLSGIYSLPDHLIEEILRWIRPEDTDWQWVCRMSATCTAFRRVMRSVKSGAVVPLTQTILWVTNINHIEGRIIRDASFLRQLKLIDTIRRSDWMGASIQRVTVYLQFDDTTFSTLEAIRSLLTTPKVLPNLAELDTCCSVHLPFLANSSFLRGLAKEHPGLSVLSLLSSRDHIDNRDNYVSPRAFARLSDSLPNLQKFTMSMVSWLEPNHLTAFFSNVGSNLRHLELDFFRSSRLGNEGFESIAAHCHNLETFILRGYVGTIQSRPFANILRSNRNLSTLNMSYSRCDAGPLLNAFVEQSPQLKTFEALFL